MRGFTRTFAALRQRGEKRDVSLLSTNQKRYTEETLILSGEKKAVRNDVKGFRPGRKGK